MSRKKGGRRRSRSRPWLRRLFFGPGGASPVARGRTTRQETVSHSAGEYSGDVLQTKSIQKVSGLFKRSVVGTFHHMSVKHLDAYLDELEWRFNNRENPNLFRDTIKKLIESEKLEFAKLTA